MRGVTYAIHSCLAALGGTALLTLAACTDAPTRPSPTPTTIRVELVAPGTIAPGATVQLRLIAHKSDGSTEDMTARATFYAGSSEVLVVTPNGVATGGKVGEAHVSGSAGRDYDSREIVIAPDGTFRVVGRVVEEDTPDLPIAGVRVEAAGSGVSASTDFFGSYRLYGVPANGLVRLSKRGYQTKELTLTLSDHHIENVALALAGPRLDAAGVYRLTIDAAPECRGQIPEPLLTRHYSAVVSQSDNTIQVEVKGTGLYGILYGSVDRTGFSLSAGAHGYCEYGWPSQDLLEFIDDKTGLSITGLARLSAAGPHFTGVLSGALTLLGPGCNEAQTYAFCSSPSHRVMLTRP